MTLKNLILLSAALGVGVIGVGYLVSPQFMLALYGVSIESVNEANIFRSAYGGLFVAFALLFAYGAFRPAYSQAALLALAAYMGGFALGRIVSIAVDGVPSPLILGWLSIEVFYSSVAVYLLANRASAHNHSLQARRP